MKIPFNHFPHLDNNFKHFQSPKEFNKLSSNGAFSKLCEEQLDQMTQQKNLLVPSATAALEMMALLLEIKPGDEVIVPSYTFVSTANAFSLRGANIVFADNDMSGNIIPEEIDRLCTTKTKAVCVVHYGGNSPNMDTVLEICNRKKITLLEDAAQCIGAKYRGKPLGTLGSIGCFSFHDTKNITAGEGGSLIINDQSHLERAQIIRDKGTNRNAFIQGHVDKYTWRNLGSSYCLSELNSAYLYPQLLQVDNINKKRNKIWHSYFNKLNHTFLDKEIQVIHSNDYNTPNYHMFAVVTKSLQQRTKLLSALSKGGVQATFHYSPLHESPFGLKYNSKPLPNCTTFSERVLRLPLWYNMSDKEIEYVSEICKKTTENL